MKYYNFISTNNTNIYEERTILRKWMEIKIDLFYYILLIKIRNITILYNYYIIKIIFYIRVIFFIKIK